MSDLGQFSLGRDNVIGHDGGARQIATVTGDVSDGHTVELTVGVDTSTQSTGGGVRPGTDGTPQPPPMVMAERRPGWHATERTPSDSSTSPSAS